MLTNSKKGYIHLYTGNGKGKTTAALGLALRAAGAGLKVYIAQFAKQGNYSELNSLKKLNDTITIEQFGNGDFIVEKASPREKAIAQHGFSKVESVINEGACDMVILDEICIALHFELIDTQQLIQVLKNRPSPIEIVLTGRNAPPEIIEIADLVTEMKEIKHYYSRGVQSRKGIEE
ncbi:MAG: cob(I)yrinic acid a,c-diamide adenosyltransferase [Chitinivibrionales bacterium]|nr:cob(I)yrinic acid a,c-diamide adenosyltransferase [Chitinivibrionales bacterium]